MKRSEAFVRRLLLQVDWIHTHSLCVELRVCKSEFYRSIRFQNGLFDALRESGQASFAQLRAAAVTKGANLLGNCFYNFLPKKQTMCIFPLTSNIEFPLYYNVTGI